MAATITQVKPMGQDSGVYTCKIVVTGGTIANVPCGFYPSAVLVMSDATTDSFHMWTADMAQATFGTIITAAGFDTQDGVVLVTATSDTDDITDKVNGFKLDCSNVLGQGDGTLYVLAFR